MKVERRKLFNDSHESVNSVFAWFLVETMSDAGIEKFTLEDGSLPEVFDIVMTVDGHEVNVLDAMANLQEQLTDFSRKAREGGYNDAWLEMDTFVSEKTYSS